MTLATFNPPVRPSPGTQRAFKPKLFEAEFGDGYSLAAPVGLNHIARQVSFRWDALTPAQAQTILSFLEARGGYRPFYYTLQNEDDPRKWTCREWSFEEGPPGKITAVFVENFSNAT